MTLTSLLKNSHQRSNIRVNKRSCNRNSCKLINLETTSWCQGNQDWQELEETIPRRIQDNIHRTCRSWQATCCHDSDYPFDNPGRSQWPKEGLENTWDHRNKAVKEISLWCIPLIKIKTSTCWKTTNLEDLRINIRHMVTDNYLILSTCLNNSNNVITVLKVIIICFRFIFQIKAQTCHTVF